MYKILQIDFSFGLERVKIIHLFQAFSLIHYMRSDFNDLNILVYWHSENVKKVVFNPKLILVPRLRGLKTGLIAETSHINHILPRCFKDTFWYRISQPRCTIKKGVLKNFVITCVGILFLIKLQAFIPVTLVKIDSNTGVLIWLLRNFKGHLFWRTSANGCFWLIAKYGLLKLY